VKNSKVAFPPQKKASQQVKAPSELRVAPGRVRLKTSVAAGLCGKNQTHTNQP
jgi:hypothetical protein